MISAIMRIEDYLESFDRAVALYRANDLDEALRAAEATVALAPTLRARFNRAMVLLAMGHWVDGLEQYECRLEFGEPFLRIAETGDIPRWDGSGPLTGKRLLLMHEQGFGDTIMMLRYVPLLRALGADVMLAVPPELERIAIRVRADRPAAIRRGYLLPDDVAATSARANPRERAG